MKRAKLSGLQRNAKALLSDETQSLLQKSTSDLRALAWVLVLIRILEPF